MRFKTSCLQLEVLNPHKDQLLIFYILHKYFLHLIHIVAILEMDSHTQYPYIYYFLHAFPYFDFYWWGRKTRQPEEKPLWHERETNSVHIWPWLILATVKTGQHSHHLATQQQQQYHHHHCHYHHHHMITCSGSVSFTAR